MAAKIDIKKQCRSLYAPRRSPHFVDAPPFRYLMIDGDGSPAEAAFQGAVEALFSTAYKIKFRFKAEGRADFVVPPLEALWWADDEPAAFEEQRFSEWRWTAMLVRPEHVSASDIDTALAELGVKGKLSEAHGKLRRGTLEEGRAVQMLHVGPYESTPDAIRTMYAHAVAHGLRLGGKHHEIYLSNPRRTAPEKLKTVLRRPVR